MNTLKMNRRAIETGEKRAAPGLSFDSGFGAVIIVLLGTFLLGSVALGGETIYKYRDEAGVIHFVKDPEEAPRRYRKSLREVKGKVTVLKGGKTGLDKKSIFFFGSKETSPPPTSPAGIVWSHLWRSRLALSLLTAIVLILLLGAGMFLSRDLIRRYQRKRYRRLLPATCLMTLIFLWLSLAGPQALRFFEGCGEGAHFALSEKGIDPQMSQKLRLMREACYRWEDRTKMVVWTIEES